MYTMVLMMAVTSSGDVSGFGHRKSGCHGDTAGCYGSVVASNYSGMSSGCTGTVAGAGYAGNSCQGSGYQGSSCTGNSCQGGKAGIFGLRGKLFGGKSSSCHGSCHGTSAPVAQDCCPPATSTGCTGGVITMPPVTPPKDMPKPMDKPKEDPKSKTESN